MKSIKMDKLLCDSCYSISSIVCSHRGKVFGGLLKNNKIPFPVSEVTAVKFLGVLIVYLVNSF